MNLDESVAQIAEREICEKDRERYKKFMELSTLGDRINATGKIFIQQLFRIHGMNESCEWKRIRVTRTSDSFTVSYLYTVQDLSDEEKKMADYVYENHPELLTEC